METVEFKYVFTLKDGTQKKFELVIDKPSMTIKNLDIENPPAWTELDFHKCENCPLKSEESPHCPVALCLTEIARKLGHLLSHEEVDVEVIGGERKLSQKVSLQRGTGALLGLYMAVSGCPHTGFFKPMARFHLPFADEEETTYRVTSMYLLAQFFVEKSGGDFEKGFEGLKKRYEKMQVVNAGIADRLRNSGDYKETNAIAMLDFFAQMVPFFIGDSLEEIRYLFTAYMDD